ncbi:PIN domain-containing protein [Effusibacillus lacus]|uniref:Ribonuclease VapC n=1 Tax=Effusibacillus lacus TaxID=1348429 RepID=A0A292YKU5_9BACL|nr:PIN domain-containing protein [Effusibacillus lacus]GAX89531.1 hypothetical protein EFBL_1155 [Effusibacillus lacus]
MFFADTNFLVSYFAGDSNSHHAERVMEEIEAGKIRLIIPVGVIQECCHIFEKAERFALPKEKIANTLIPFLLTSGIEAEDRDVVVAALRKFHEKNVDFMDAYLAARSSASGVPIVSFDKDFKKLDCQVYNPQKDKVGR